jgi:hypothetical protein
MQHIGGVKDMAIAHIYTMIVSCYAGVQQQHPKREYYDAIR